jgi:hypothetical protein
MVMIIDLSGSVRLFRKAACGANLVETCSEELGETTVDCHFVKDLV